MSFDENRIQHFVLRYHSFCCFQQVEIADLGIFVIIFLVNIVNYSQAENLDQGFVAAVSGQNVLILSKPLIGLIIEVI